MKKILLVADLKGWVFERHCREIKKRLSHKYHLDITYCRGAPDVRETSKKYDLVYVLDPLPINYPPKEKTIMGLRCQWLYETHPKGAKGLYNNGLPGRCAAPEVRCCMLHVVNKNMLNTFKDIVTDRPLLLAQHGVDETIFNRDLYEEKEYSEEPFTPLIVGMSGRKRSDGKKGFDAVQKACKKDGHKFIEASYEGRKLKKKEMPNFYRKMDVYVCFSKSEGLNNPVLEAGAMGIPVISTKCGAAEEIIKQGSNGLLIDRDLNALRDALALLSNTKFRKTASNNMYETIMKKWTWEHRIKDFENMFDMYFEGK